MMDPDRFCKIASGVQSIITAIGITNGGAWVLFTFWDLGVTEKSRAETAEIEQRAVEQPILAININLRAYSKTSNGQYYVSLNTIFKNDGKRALSLQDVFVRISPLSEKSGEPDANSDIIMLKSRQFEVGSKMSEMPTRLLRSGQARSLSFFVPPLSAGSYFVQLQATYSGQLLVNGDFVQSPDVPIEAIEQSIVTVPTIEPSAKQDLSRPD